MALLLVRVPPTFLCLSFFTPNPLSPSSLQIPSLSLFFSFSTMDSKTQEISKEAFPYIRLYKDGTVQRLAGTEVAPPSPTGENAVVLSKDVVVSEETGLSARLYRPKHDNKKEEELPLLIYFHGGGFFISSPSDPPYHRSLTALVAEARVIAVSVGYRKCPEHPLPTAYDDAQEALRWIASHKKGGNGGEAWLRDGVDFRRVFLAGDSAGANIAHHISMRAENPGRRVDPIRSLDPDQHANGDAVDSGPVLDPVRVANSGREGGPELEIKGIVMIHPYFWGEDPIGVEVEEPERKAMVDGWWRFVCPSDRGCDDPLINPFVEGCPSLAGLECERVLVCVAEKDILRDRGRLYYKALVESGWGGTAKMLETQGVDHVFHIFDPSGEKAVEFFKRLASFINQDAI